MSFGRALAHQSDPPSFAFERPQAAADLDPEIVKKPFFRDEPMVWSSTKKKWYVISQDGDWKEFVGDEKDIEWKVEK